MVGTVVVLLLLELAIVALAGNLYAFAVGLRAFQRATTVAGDARQSLRWLGLNLCEPLVHSILISLLFVSMSSQSLSSFWASLGMQGRFLVLIAPMAVLLLPALGLGTSDPFYRGRNAVILLIGVLRWILTSAALALMLTPYALVSAAIGTGVLWTSATWGRKVIMNSHVARASPASSPKRD